MAETEHLKGYLPNTSKKVKIKNVKKTHKCCQDYNRMPFLTPVTVTLVLPVILLSMIELKKQSKF